MTNGCLIVNLGSPETPTEGDIKKFLSRMLSDRHVVNLAPALWKPILNGIILRVRPPKLVPTYEKLWTDHGYNGSPLSCITQSQAQKLQAQLPGAEVKHAFCYSSPTIEEALDGWDIDHLTVIPLYPQFASSTVDPVVDRVLDYYHERPEQHPHVVFATSYATEPTMIRWYQKQLQQRLQKNPVDEVLLSFHGIPDRRSHWAKHYKAQCQATCDAIAAGLPGVKVSLSFQSKFGPLEWLGPSTAEMLDTMPQEGVTKVLVATPAFVADCLETLEEIRVENRDLFLAAGGTHYDVLSPINDDPAFIDALQNVYQSLAQTNLSPETP
ncbi:MAG: ferrochelatase [Lawsonella sp.]